jgi:hypothetical protein
MRARLPSIAKGLIQFACGTDTTVGAIRQTKKGQDYWKINPKG